MNHISETPATTYSAPTLHRIGEDSHALTLLRHRKKFNTNKLRGLSKLKPLQIHSISSTMLCSQCPLVMWLVRTMTGSCRVPYPWISKKLWFFKKITKRLRTSTPSPTSASPEISNSCLHLLHNARFGHTSCDKSNVLERKLRK